ncbi:MAG: stage II sporulation protein P [Oscillospiraceae bacterium]|jgi:stage II sporulation protein P|nr:stage II sporulation protein P [Oscillospiraceae bacterium]
MKNRHPDPLTRWDALRMLTAVALCAAAVFAFRSQGGFSPGALMPDWGLGDPGDSAVIVDGTATYPAEEMTVLSESAAVAEYPPSPETSPTAAPAPSVRLNLLDPEDNVTLRDPASEQHASDSPESKEAVPEHDVRIDTITRKREGALRVLIYHTHTEEAYTPTPDYTYRTHGEWHTQNLECSIARVGEELAFILAEEYGWEVAHDTTDYEPPNFDTAYARSLQGVAAYAERGETFDLYIDMHRDSYSAIHASNTVTVGGIEAARLRLLVGKGGDFDQKPDWEQNLTLAQSITDRLNAIAPTLAASVYLSPRNRYNQHVSTNAVLVEVGNNLNTMEEALAVVPFLAEALDAVMGE